LAAAGATRRTGQRPLWVPLQRRAKARALRAQTRPASVPLALRTLTRPEAAPAQPLRPSPQPHEQTLLALAPP